MEKYQLISFQLFGNCPSSSSKQEHAEKVDLLPGGGYKLSWKGPFVDLSAEHGPRGRRIRRKEFRSEEPFAGRACLLRCLICYSGIVENRKRKQVDDDKQPEEEEELLLTFVNLLLGNSLHSNNNPIMMDGDDVERLESETRKLTSMKSNKTGKIAYLCPNCDTAVCRFVRAYHAWKRLEEEISEMRAKFRSAIKLSTRFSEIDGHGEGDNVVTEPTLSNHSKMILRAVEYLRKRLLHHDSSSQTEIIGQNEENESKRKQQQTEKELRVTSPAKSSHSRVKPINLSRQQRWAKIQEMYPGISRAKYNELVRKKREEKLKLSMANRSELPGESGTGSDKIESHHDKTVPKIGKAYVKAKAVSSTMDGIEIKKETDTDDIVEMPEVNVEDGESDKSAAGSCQEDSLPDSNHISDKTESHLNPQQLGSDHEPIEVDPPTIQDVDWFDGNVFDENEIADAATANQDQDSHLNSVGDNNIDEAIVCGDVSPPPPHQKDNGARKETKGPEPEEPSSSNIMAEAAVKAKGKRHYYRPTGILNPRFHTNLKTPLSNSPLAIRLRKQRSEHPHLSRKEVTELLKQQRSQNKKSYITTPEQREKGRMNHEKYRARREELYPGMSYTQYMELRRRTRMEEQKLSSDGIPGRAGKGAGIAVKVKKVLGEDGRTRYFYKDFEITRDEEGKVFGCVLCEERKWKTEELARSHINRHHVDLSNGYECEVCHKRFYYHNDFLGHVKRAHGKPEYPCEICGEMFSSVGSRSTHRRVVHEGIKPHICEHCGKTFGRLKDMLLHVRRHNGERPFVCHVCPDAFFDKQSMKKHIQRKHPEAAKELPPPANRGRSKRVEATCNE